MTAPLKTDHPLLTLQDSLALTSAETGDLYRNHLNPRLFDLYRALGLSEMDVESAEGLELRLREGRTILDFSSAMGVLGLGHNHPRIVGAERACHANRVADAIKMGPHKLQAALAYNLAQLLPGNLNVSFLATSGAEAVEAALKICEKAQGESRSKFVTMKNSFHGKTHGALSVTTSGSYRRGFYYGIPKERVIEIPFGDVEALKEVIERETTSGQCSVTAVILEPMQGEGLEESPPGYLKAITELCKANGILTIFDEVKVGMWRTGTFCAFQSEDVVPDVVTLSKALGGGKRAISAMVADRDLFLKAYGTRQDCALHTSTFSGLGESCAVAIETLNTYVEEGIGDNAHDQGRYLGAGLAALKERYPSKIREIRGRGLLQGIHFNWSERILPENPQSVAAPVFQSVDAAVMASVIRHLYLKPGILMHFCSSYPALLHIMPPLTVETRHIDTLLRALDELLGQGFTRTVGAFAWGNATDRLQRRS